VFNQAYYPYGDEAYSQTFDPGYKFTGYERDTETELDYAFARYYNYRLGRFMSADPAGGDLSDPQSENRYAYVRNNPTNMTDPSGLCGGFSLGFGYDPFSSPFFSGGGDGEGGGRRFWFRLRVGFDSLLGLRQRPAAAHLHASGAVQSAQSVQRRDRRHSQRPQYPATEPAELPDADDPGDTFFQAGEISLPAAAGVCAEIPICGSALAWVGRLLFPVALMGSGRRSPTVDELRQNCTPGRQVAEPATGRRYKGGTSVQQEYTCSDGTTWTVHWIERDGKILHGPHIRFGPITGSGGGGGF
jgi:RHS repeat-associated protein